MYNKRLTAVAGALAIVFSATDASALSTADYMVITEMVSGDGHALIMSNSEIGAIGASGGIVSPPGSLPALPGGTERTVSAGITLDGDAAITNGGTVSINSTVQLSNSDVHALNTGAANPGGQGIDCSSSYAICTDNGSQISSNNRFNQSSPTASFSTLAQNNGIQGSIDLSGITTQLAFLRNVINGLSSTSTIDLASGLIQDQANEVWDFSGDGAGLHIVDITTNGNDFSINNSNLTIKGDAGDTIIFRVAPSWTMNVSQSNLLLDGGIGDNNVLFYVDADEGEQSFNFNNATFYGMSLWDLDTDMKNIVSFNNVQFCGQVVTDQVDFSNVSGSGCSLDTSAIPIPAAVWLFGSGLLGLVGMARRKKTTL